MNTTLYFSANVGYTSLYQSNIQHDSSGIYPVLHPYVTFLRALPFKKRK